MHVQNRSTGHMLIEKYILFNVNIYTLYSPFCFSSTTIRARVRWCPAAATYQLVRVDNTFGLKSGQIRSPSPLQIYMYINIHIERETDVRFPFIRTKRAAPLHISFSLSILNKVSAALIIQTPPTTLLECDLGTGRCRRRLERASSRASATASDPLPIPPAAPGGGTR